MNQKFINSIIINLTISTLATIILPIIANAETQTELQADTKILFEDGQPKSVSIDGKVVLSDTDG